MSKGTLIAVNESKDSADFVFQNTDPNLVATATDQFFRGCGYRLEGGEPGYGTYGIGSDMMRIFFGAFAKRYKFFVTVTAGPQTTLRVEKGMSGWMGGALGASAMKKERRRIIDGLSGLFSAPATPAPGMGV